MERVYKQSEKNDFVLLFAWVVFISLNCRFHDSLLSILLNNDERRMSATFRNELFNCHLVARCQTPNASHENIYSYTIKRIFVYDFLICKKNKFSPHFREESTNSGNETNNLWALNDMNRKHLHTFYATENPFEIFWN